MKAGHRSNPCCPTAIKICSVRLMSFGTEKVAPRNKSVVLSDMAYPGCVAERSQPPYEYSFSETWCRNSDRFGQPQLNWILPQIVAARHLTWLHRPIRPAGWGPSEADIAPSYSSRQTTRARPPLAPRSRHITPLLSLISIPQRPRSAPSELSRRLLRQREPWRPSLSTLPSPLPLLAPTRLATSKTFCLKYSFDKAALETSRIAVELHGLIEKSEAALVSTAGIVESDPGASAVATYIEALGLRSGAPQPGCWWSLAPAGYFRRPGHLGAPAGPPEAGVAGPDSDRPLVSGASTSQPEFEPRFEPDSTGHSIRERLLSKLSVAGGSLARPCCSITRRRFGGPVGRTGC